MTTNNVKLLDCTLRDGLRVVECEFPDYHLRGVVQGLTDAGIDIVEMGFLRGNVEYSGDSCFFTDMTQMEQFIPKGSGCTTYVAFVDYGLQFGMWDFNKLTERGGSPISGIRLTVRKCDFREALPVMRIIQEKGYDLYIQTVESLNYSDMELLEVIEIANKLQPYSFGIVDTFGAMYKEDVLRLYSLIDHNLDKSIHIDLHSHNNMQLSFSFAQEIVALSRKERNIIIDSTLEGVGKGAGNLNTELIVNYMNRKYGYSYDLDRILDTIDTHIHWLKHDADWGYNTPSFMAGVYSSHPNNVAYLTKMHKLRTKDIRIILSHMEPETRKVYDYDGLENLYLEYFGEEYDDHGNMETLTKTLAGREVLVVVFGATSKSYSQNILDVVNQRNPIVVSVNHIYDKTPVDFVFYGNQRRYANRPSNASSGKTIITSNIHAPDGDVIRVSYNKLVNKGVGNFDNSTMMLLNLLGDVGVRLVMLAGFDGFSQDMRSSHSDAIWSHGIENSDIDSINADLEHMLGDYAKRFADGPTVEFITPSRFAHIFKKN